MSYLICITAPLPIVLLFPPYVQFQLHYTWYYHSPLFAWGNGIIVKYKKINIPITNMLKWLYNIKKKQITNCN